MTIRQINASRISRKEFKRNSLKNQQIFFIPEKGSKEKIWGRSLELINTISDKEQLRTMFWAMMQYCSNND